MRTVIGGDFNARIGEEGGWWEIEEDNETRSGRNRNSKDKKINKDGRRLLELVEEKGWSVLNGKMTGDERGSGKGYKEAKR